MVIGMELVIWCWVLMEWSLIGLFEVFFIGLSDWLELRVLIVAIYLMGKVVLRVVVIGIWWCLLMVIRWLGLDRFELVFELIDFKVFTGGVLFPVDVEPLLAVLLVLLSCIIDGGNSLSMKKIGLIMINNCISLNWLIGIHMNLMNIMVVLLRVYNYGSLLNWMYLRWMRSLMAVNIMCFYVRIYYRSLLLLLMLWWQLILNYIVYWVDSVIMHLWNSTFICVVDYNCSFLRSYLRWYVRSTILNDWTLFHVLLHQ